MSFAYFTDRDLGKCFPDILRSGGLRIERHADHFEPGTPDDVWLEEIGKRGWIALTHDQRIRYKPNERDAVIRHGVGLLVIIGSAPIASDCRARQCIPCDVAACRAIPRHAESAVHSQGLPTIPCPNCPAQRCYRTR